MNIVINHLALVSPFRWAERNSKAFFFHYVSRNLQSRSTVVDQLMPVVVFNVLIRRHRKRRCPHSKGGTDRTSPLTYGIEYLPYLNIHFRNPIFLYVCLRSSMPLVCVRYLRISLTEIYGIIERFRRLFSPTAHRRKPRYFSNCSYYLQA